MYKEGLVREQAAAAKDAEVTLGILNTKVKMIFCWPWLTACWSRKKLF